MKKVLVFVAALLSCGVAFGQQLLPAKQVTVTTTNWGDRLPASATAQQVFDLTTTNFGLVNRNTTLSSNLFLSVVSQMFGLSGYDEPPVDPTPQEEQIYQAYTNFVGNVSLFSEMDLEYSGLPEGLSFLFPDLLAPLRFGLSTVSDEVDGILAFRTFAEVSGTGSVFSVSSELGPDQVIQIQGHNTTISFDPPAMGAPATINLWVKNAGYTNVAYTGAVQVNTNAFDISGQSAISYSRYHASPFASPNVWYEEPVFPYGTEAIAPPPPASQDVSISVAGLSNCTYLVTTNTVAGVSSEIHTFYPTTAGSNATATVTTSSNAALRVLVVGGGGGGGAPFGGGGGGGRAVLDVSFYLTAGSYALSVGKGGAGGTSSTETIVKSDGSAGVGSSFHTLSAAGGSGGIGWTPWSGPGGKGGASGPVSGGEPSSGTYAGGGGAGPVTGGSGTGSGATNEHGGKGADGLVDAPRGNTERFGAGGGGGQYATSRVSNYGGAGGGGNGGINSTGSQAGGNATGWGAGGGGSVVGAAGSGFGGIIVISRPL